MTKQNHTDDINANTPASLVKAFYAALSFPAGSKPDYESLSGLFHSQSAIVPPAADTGGAIKALTAPDFFKLYGPQLEEFSARGFLESEIFKSESEFGNVAHYLSGYQMKVGGELHSFRGINLFNLVRENGKWWIISLIWDRAAPPLVPSNLTSE
jgi:hypothetical protein